MTTTSVKPEAPLPASKIHGLVLPFAGKTPVFGRDAFVAPNATVIGDVEIGDDASVWFGAVLRGDIGRIVIGARTNVQDLACVHLTEGLSTTVVGADVTIGHGAILHGCLVGDGALIGMGSILLDNVEVGAESVIAAGTVVPPRMIIPPRSLVRGNPGRIIREVNATERTFGIDGALHYIAAARRFRQVLREEDTRREDEARKLELEARENAK